MVFSSTLQIKKLQHYLKKYFTVFQELAWRTMYFVTCSNYLRDSAHA
jgi:hypothetical protein